MIGLGYITAGIGITVIVLLVATYLRIYLQNKRLGTPGIVSRSRLTCARCNQTFDYDYVPGASFTSFRLGRSRYMACPICNKWSLFNLSATRVPVGAPKS